MIIPGLDRIDGTCVNGQLLDSDVLWQEHTAELLELLDEANSSSGAAAEDAVSMMEFCAPYAAGIKTTLAMRRAKVRHEWRVDPYAVHLQAYESRTLSAAPPTAPVEASASSSRPNRRKNASSSLLMPQPPKQLEVAHQVPLARAGVVVCCGNGFVYHSDAARQAVQRIQAVLESEGGFYPMPEHAFHITLATLQRFQFKNDDDGSSASSPSSSSSVAEAAAQRLRASAALAREIRRGPFKLVVDSVAVPASGDAVVLLFRDPDNRIRDLRAALGLEDDDDKTGVHVPDIIHSTLARVSSLPSCSREDLLQRVQGVAEGVEIEVSAVNLVEEEFVAYMHGFPLGVHATWNLRRSSSTQEVEVKKEEEDEKPAAAAAAAWHWLDGDQVIVVAVALLAASIALRWHS